MLKIERSRPLNSKLFYQGLSVHHITNCVTYIELSFTTYGTTYLIPFAQFKKREKNHGGVLLLIKVTLLNGVFHVL